MRVEFIGRCLADEVVQAYHVYFPDPWPKTRHHRRRFFQTNTVGQVIRTLMPGGQLRLATDHTEYFQWICEVILEDPQIIRYLEPVDFEPVDAAADGEWVGSNFERKYAREGRPTHRLAFVKR